MFKEAITSFIYFDNKWCFFAIDNICNNKCEMCSIWKEKNPKIVRFENAKRVIDKLYENNFRVLQLTGGEPLLNPDFFEIVKYAKKMNFLVFAPTNGTLIDENIAEKLKESEIDQISISLHHYKAEKLEKISGRKGILKKLTKSIKILNENKLPVSILCTISRDNMNDLEGLLKFVKRFDAAISFCMPIMNENTSFKLGGNRKSVDLSKDELKSVLLEIVRLKKKGYNIVNSFTYLFDTLKYLNDENRYDCFGGSKLFYIDWNLNVYPCMCKGKPTNIDNYNFTKRNETCNKCLIQCFREPSILLKKRRTALKVFLRDIPFLSTMAIKRLKTII